MRTRPLNSSTVIDHKLLRRNTLGIGIDNGLHCKYINVYRHTEIEGKTDNVAAAETEIFVGDIVRAGIENGLNIHATKVSDHPFLDIGTADDLQSPPH